MLETIHNRYIY